MRKLLYMIGTALAVLAIAAQAVAGEVCTVTITANCDQVTVIVDQYKGDHTEAQVRIDDGDVLPFAFDGDEGMFQVDVHAAKQVDARGQVFIKDGRLVGTFHRTVTFDQSGCDKETTPPPPTAPPPTIPTEPAPPKHLAFTGATFATGAGIVLALVVAGTVLLRATRRKPTA